MHSNLRHGENMPLPTAARVMFQYKGIIGSSIMMAAGIAYPEKLAARDVVLGVLKCNSVPREKPISGGRGLLEAHLSAAASTRELSLYEKMTRSVNAYLYSSKYPLANDTAKSLIDNLVKNGSNENYAKSPSITHAGELHTFFADGVEKGFREDNLTGVIAHLAMTLVTAPLDSDRTAPDNPFL
ncbi:hypothetical protein RBA41_08645 [Massilia sp. CCM 9210]|uniref:hypothetical protein n=1 Tax=Massilia scottii TaxID=3057166 RepID=UPI002796DECE|nr:hypothetical protein [Massilia sp. CCM 9210]MDQ1813369.1 hypothetical protein [Massilia sp. CCM 9210]